MLSSQELTLLSGGGGAGRGLYRPLFGSFEQEERLWLAEADRSKHGLFLTVI